MYIFYHVLSTDDCEEMERQMDRWIENDRKIDMEIRPFTDHL
jgi:hypothetical protein